MRYQVRIISPSGSFPLLQNHGPYRLSYAQVTNMAPFAGKGAVIRCTFSYNLPRNAHPRKCYRRKVAAARQDMHLVTTRLLLPCRCARQVPWKFAHVYKCLSSRGHFTKWPHFKNFEGVQSTKGTVTRTQYFPQFARQCWFERMLTRKTML